MKQFRRTVRTAFVAFASCIVSAAEPPPGCLQKLLDAEVAPLSACGDVVGRLSAARIGTLPRGAALYLIRERSGGSGVFSAMLATTEKNGVLRRVFMVVGGDRCNGGIKSASMLPDGGFVIERNQTPFALGTGEEYCAACCAGVKEERYDRDGALIDKRAD